MKERMKNMKTDIQIAQEAEMNHIRDVAASIGIEEDNLELYGKYKAKLSDDLYDKSKGSPRRQTCSCNSNQSDSGRRG